MSPLSVYLQGNWRTPLQSATKPILKAIIPENCNLKNWWISIKLLCLLAHYFHQSWLQVKISQQKKQEDFIKEWWVHFKANTASSTKTLICVCRNRLFSRSVTCFRSNTRVLFLLGPFVFLHASDLFFSFSKVVARAITRGIRFHCSVLKNDLLDALIW